MYNPVSIEVIITVDARGCFERKISTDKYSEYLENSLPDVYKVTVKFVTADGDFNNDSHIISITANTKIIEIEEIHRKVHDSAKVYLASL